MARHRSAAALVGVAGIVGAIACPALAGAQADGQLRLMREPHSYVDVVDAFDADDPFDVNLTVGFGHRREWGTVQRERGTFTPAPGEDPNRSSRLWENVATHEHTQNTLQLGLDVGLFRDLAAYASMPLILSDDRRLSPVGDPSALLQANDTLASDPAGRVPPPLFSVDGGFAAPTRSGLDYISGGLAWSIMNQHRDPALPTWVLMVEGRFNVGDPMVACQQTAGGPQCRRWAQQPGGAWSFDDAGTNAGMTRGTNALRVETRASWRTREVEPYAGLMFQIEWAANAERFFLPAGNLSGIINDRPPILGELTGGVAIHPWENRADWQRFTIDLRVHGRYVSEGHTYSPLFDALGTSLNRYLTQPALEGDPSIDPGAALRQVPFFGLTDVQSHAELGLHLGLEARAARYVRFGLDTSLWYVQPYIITYADACNPNVDNVPEGDARRGTCRSGIINPHHRTAIDTPGQRFRVDEQIRLQVQVSATAQF
jgi:hypothetical protein